ncbi:DUF4358 domain-containing protein [Paenibacillus sp. PL91]|uniref:DUF4358 domain-containing protein n=1 Tax=Paenibacillus sp. PL91 TaxID=2729538 RepID=UPI00145E6EA2|nr:DUF4358 domain-containing protein [Paenibacillus sp. PL91]MBC9198306.1 DUF4358 domain-containing protein [Paenibacillus sp. PL91]
MFPIKNKYFIVAIFAIMITVMAAGCSNGASEEKNSANPTHTTGAADALEATDAADEPTATTEPAATIVPTENAATEEPAATAAPTEDLTTEKPASTLAPTKDASTEKPAATKKPIENSEAKETEVAKPTKKPASTPKPEPAAKPTKKPGAVIPTQEPSVKPSATPTPSTITMATPSPTPKPTTKPDPENPFGEVTVADIAAKITADAGLGPLTAVEDDQVKDVYGIDMEALLVDGIFYQPKMMIQAGEFSVVHLKSEKDYADIEAAFEKRAEAVQKAFETYLPDQYEQALNYQIISNGNFVLFSISPDQEKTAEIFNGFFKK